MRLLFVENNPIFANVVTTQFLAEHQVETVPSVGAARERIKVNAYDALLVDYDLDDAKGSELIAEVRSSGLNMLIIAVSSHDDGNNALHKAGANLVCKKSDFGNIASILANAGNA